jgi:hypothetical protein
VFGFPLCRFPFLREPATLKNPGRYTHPLTGRDPQAVAVTEREEHSHLEMITCTFLHRELIRQLAPARMTHPRCGFNRAHGARIRLWRCPPARSRPNGELGRATARRVSHLEH